VSTPILQEKHDRILILRINRPDQKNALTKAMYTDLADGIAEAHNDPDIRVILIAGNNECFTAGNDLSEFENGMPEDFRTTPVGVSSSPSPAPANPSSPPSTARRRHRHHPAAALRPRLGRLQHHLPHALRQPRPLRRRRLQPPAATLAGPCPCR